MRIITGVTHPQYIREVFDNCDCNAVYYTRVLGFYERDGITEVITFEPSGELTTTPLTATGLTLHSGMAPLEQNIDCGH